MTKTTQLLLLGGAVIAGYVLLRNRNTAAAATIPGTPGTASGGENNSTGALYPGGQNAGTLDSGNIQMSEADKRRLAYASRMAEYQQALIAYELQGRIYTAQGRPRSTWPPAPQPPRM